MLLLERLFGYSYCFHQLGLRNQTFIPVTESWPWLKADEVGASVHQDQNHRNDFPFTVPNGKVNEPGDAREMAWIWSQWFIDHLILLFRKYQQDYSPVVQKQIPCSLIGRDQADPNQEYHRAYNQRSACHNDDWRYCVATKTQMSARIHWTCLFENHLPGQR